MRLRGAVLLVVAALCAVACGARFKDTGNASANAGLGVGGGSSQLQTSGPGDSLVPGAASAGAATTIAGATTTIAGQAASVDPGATTGLTATTIKIGYLLPITGAAPVPQSFDKGVNAYYDDINAKGGINGRKIVPVVDDTQSQASVGKTMAQKQIEQDKVFAIVVLDRLENQKAIGDYIESRHVPNIEVQTPPDLATSNAQWTFGVTIDHAVQGKLIADYFVHVLHATKVGVVQENTPILNPGVDQFTKEIDALGAKVTYHTSIDGQGNDYSSEALALSRSGATATWLYMAPTPAAKLVNQADAVGYHPTWFANSISWAFDLIFAVGRKPLTGARAFSPWLPLSDPRTQAYQDAYRKDNPNSTPDDLGIIGWGIGQIVGQGVRNAGPRLGQNSFRDAMQHLQFRPDVWAPLKFGPGVRQGANVVAVLKEDGGHWALERDFSASF